MDASDRPVRHASRHVGRSDCRVYELTALTARSSSRAENAPSNFVRMTPLRSTTYVNGSVGSRHCFTHRLTPFAGSLSL